MTNFKPMRSVALDDKYPVQFPVLGSYKLDGIRIVKHNGKALTKSLKSVPNKAICRWVEQNLPDGVDGEIISGPPNVETVYSSTFTAAMTKEGEFEFKLYLFDLHNEELMFAIERYRKLQNIVRSLPVAAAERVVVVEKKLLHSMEEVEQMYSEALENGYEGLILQDPTAFYKYGRSTAKAGTQLKLKPEEDFEFEVLGAYEAMFNGNEAFTNEVGETARSKHQENLVGKDSLGGFFAKDCASGVEFKVAPGKLKHDERDALWAQWLANPDSLIGRIGRYRCMGYGEMANGRPRHGRFYGWRDRSDLSLED